MPLFPIPWEAARRDSRDIIPAGSARRFRIPAAGLAVRNPAVRSSSAPRKQNSTSGLKLARSNRRDARRIKRDLKNTGPATCRPDIFCARDRPRARRDEEKLLLLAALGGLLCAALRGLLAALCGLLT